MFYLTLHGETEWNRERRFQGQLDSPLTARGVEQAHLMGATLRELVGDSTGYTIVSSQLGRARRTAEIICEVLKSPSGEIETDARLAEINLGSWSGLTRDEVAARWPGALDGSGRYDWYFRSPDGETFDAVSSRVRQWLSEATGRDRMIVCLAWSDQPHPARPLWQYRKGGGPGDSRYHATWSSGSTTNRSTGSLADRHPAPFL